MLVLSRRKNESIVINNDVVVAIVDIRGDKVRLGVEAPSDMPVYRREVWEVIQKEKLERRKAEVEHYRKEIQE